MKSAYGGSWRYRINRYGGCRRARSACCARWSAELCFQGMCSINQGAQRNIFRGKTTRNILSGDGICTNHSITVAGIDNLEYMTFGECFTVQSNRHRWRGNIGDIIISQNATVTSGHQIHRNISQTCWRDHKLTTIKIMLDRICGGNIINTTIGLGLHCHSKRVCIYLSGND